MLYLFGSRVYGTYNKNSDYDYILTSKYNFFLDKEIKIGKYNIHIYTQSKFIELLENHHVGALEAYLRVNDYPINISKLRHSFSQAASNSYVKCKKKMLQGDYEIGIKSMFHALRITMFGIQIAKYGKIIDYSEANYIYYDLISRNWTWEEIDEKCRPLRNKLNTEFRKVCSYHIGQGI